MSKKKNNRNPMPKSQGKKPLPPTAQLGLMLKMIEQIQSEVRGLQMRTIPSFGSQLHMAFQNAFAADRRSECRSMAILKLAWEGDLTTLTPEEVTEKVDAYFLEAMAVHAIINTFAGVGRAAHAREEAEKQTAEQESSEDESSKG